MKTPVAIIGGGPAGSASAMFLRAHGIDCVIIEKEQFPPLPHRRVDDRRVRRQSFARSGWKTR